MYLVFTLCTYCFYLFLSDVLFWFGVVSIADDAVVAVVTHRRVWLTPRPEAPISFHKSLPVIR